MQKASLDAIRENETMLLQEKDREVFIEALLASPEPNKALKAAAALYEKRRK